MVNPPKEGDPSFQKYKEERDSIYTSLKRRAEKLVRFLNTLDGVSCNPAQGNFYSLFSNIFQEPCMHFLKSKYLKEQLNLLNPRIRDQMISIVWNFWTKLESVLFLVNIFKDNLLILLGSGFGQRDGTYHFRTTFLPPEDQIDGVLSKVAKFHGEFMNKYK
jgi:alanine transaminase